jgi:hypothetical protein
LVAVVAVGVAVGVAVEVAVAVGLVVAVGDNAVVRKVTRALTDSFGVERFPEYR